MQPFNNDNTPPETRPRLVLPLDVAARQLPAVDEDDESSPEIYADDLPFLSRPPVTLRTPTRTLVAKKISHPRGVSLLGEAWNRYEKASVGAIEQFQRAIESVYIDMGELDDAAVALYRQLVDHMDRISPDQAKAYRHALSNSTMRRPITWARENLRNCISSSLQTIRTDIEDNYIRDSDSLEAVRRSELYKAVQSSNRNPATTILCGKEMVPSQCSICYTSFDVIEFWSVFHCSCKFPSVCWDCGIVVSLLSQHRSSTYTPRCRSAARISLSQGCKRRES